MSALKDLKKWIKAAKKLHKHVEKSKSESNSYVGLYSEPPPQMVTYSMPYYSSSSVMMTSTAFYGVSTAAFGGSQSHGYYDAGVNNKKMVSDLEAKVAELKAELEKKKIQEMKLTEPEGDGKRVVEI